MNLYDDNDDLHRFRIKFQDLEMYEVYETPNENYNLKKIKEEEKIISRKEVPCIRLG